MRVSVCVPTYERPEMLLELVHSFKAQDYKDRELCITDDSRGDETEQLIASIPSGNIRYFRNSSTLGFAQNLKRALWSASGEVLVLMGDDDVLAAKDSLSRYARAFASHSDAHFAYANLIQVDQRLRATLAYPLFPEDVCVAPGADAVESLWLRSILITGLALRRSPLLLELYPEGTPLFPQVELVARLLLRHSGMGLSDYLCATRAHVDQLGFKAIRGELLQGEERHGNIEILDIFERVSSGHAEMTAVRPKIERQLKSAYLTNLPNEKILTGNWAMSRNFLALVLRSPVARHSTTLWLAYVGSLLLPRPVLLQLKESVRGLVARRRFKAAGIDPGAPLSVVAAGSGVTGDHSTDQRSGMGTVDNE